MPAHIPGTTWPIKKKIEVVAAYLVLGKAPLVEAATGVSRDLIRQWKTQPWWKEIEADLRQEEDVELDNKLRNILDKTLATVLDRVENGDFIYDPKTKKISRKPVSLKDVHKVSVDLIDKRQLIQGKPTKRVETAQSTGDHLKALAEQFAQFAGMNKKKEKVIDGEEVIDVLPEKPVEETLENSNTKI